MINNNDAFLYKLFNEYFLLEIIKLIEKYCKAEIKSIEYKNDAEKLFLIKNTTNKDYSLYFIDISIINNNNIEYFNIFKNYINNIENTFYKNDNIKLQIKDLINKIKAIIDKNNILDFFNYFNNLENTEFIFYDILIFIKKIIKSNLAKRIQKFDKFVKYSVSLDKDNDLDYFYKKKSFFDKKLNEILIEEKENLHFFLKEFIYILIEVDNQIKEPEVFKEENLKIKNKKKNNLIKTFKFDQNLIIKENFEKENNFCTNDQFYDFILFNPFLFIMPIILLLSYKKYKKVYLILFFFLYFLYLISIIIFLYYCLINYDFNFLYLFFIFNISNLIFSFIISSSKHRSAFFLLSYYFFSLVFFILLIFSFYFSEEKNINNKINYKV